MLNILRQKPQDLGVKQYAIQCLEQAGSFDYCRLYPKNLFSKAKLEARKVKLGERGENAVMAFLENLEKKAL